MIHDVSGYLFDAILWLHKKEINILGMMRRFGICFRSYLQASQKQEINIVGIIRRLMYLLTAIGWTPGGSSTVHIYTNNT